MPHKSSKARPQTTVEKGPRKVTGVVRASSPETAGTSSSESRKPAARPASAKGLRRPPPVRMRRMSKADSAALEAFKKRRAEAPPPVEVSLHNLTVGAVDVAHAANLFNSGDETFTVGLCRQLEHITATGQPLPIDRLNFALSVINAIRPRDAMEALLASHMAAIHCAIMHCVRRSAGATTIDRLAAEQNMLGRLMRTFAMLMDCLKKCRGNGEQKISVQHVHVNADKAIVGISQGEGKSENGNQPLGPSQSHEPSTPLLSHIETFGLGLSLSGGDGLEGVSVPRRQIRGA